MLLLLPGRRPMFPPRDRIKPSESGLVALGGDLRPVTILEAYSKGLFPWQGRQPIPWYSPDPRMVLEPQRFRASRSLRKLARQGRLTLRRDTCFSEVMRQCATVPRPGQKGSWISPRMIRSYTTLHQQGHAHSIEVFAGEELVGGLYGLSMGSVFFGESMFHTRRDASKLALYHLSALLFAWGYALIDCQQETPHLARLGAAPIPRAVFMERLQTALMEPDRWGVDMGDRTWRRE